MEHSFWEARWAQGQTAFHEGAPNRFLLRHGELLGSAGRVLVPLCGKSVDLDALAEQGLEVTGCELVEQAVREYFAERHAEPIERAVGALRAFTADAVPHVRVLCGDVFALDDAHGRFDALFDRAAVVALPLEMRERYVPHIASRLEPGARGLLVTFEHDTGSGPPFSVERDEVLRLYTPHYLVEELAREHALADNPRIVERGATRVFECAYALTRR
ncbi:MAG: thiopurine S-methyltransferase [Deltaproteobacteria bacterium]|nr:thiopurine S-methyltransferase [Deltaproteobacteria bacterium]